MAESITLRKYFDEQGRGSCVALAGKVGTSDGHLSDIANGKRFAGRELALRIQAATDGRVRAATCMGLEAA